MYKQEKERERQEKIRKKEEAKAALEQEEKEILEKEMTVEDYDKNPEKRMRQAWNDYYEKQLPLYKVAYPNLKRSQYIQMIQKEFKTSSENPVYVSKIQKAKKAEEEESEK